MQACKRDEYEQEIWNEYRRLMLQGREGGLNLTEARIRCCDLLDLLLNKSNSQECLSRSPEVSFLRDALIEEQKYKTDKRNDQIGCLITALIMLGSSARHAYLATGEFLGYKTGSLETSKKIHQRYRKENLQEDDVEHFLHIHIYKLQHLIQSARNPFPSRFDKAQCAYEKLLIQINRHLEDEDFPNWAKDFR